MNDQIYTQLGNLILALLPGADIVRGLTNRVAMPDGPFICMTPVGQTRLATNETTYNGVNQKTLTNFKQFDVQVDFYGPDAADQVNIFETAFRDEFAVDLMGPYVTPLYCSRAHQGPLVAAEQQYEERWLVTASVEFNPDVVLPQDFMTEAEIVPVSVEATYS